MTAKEARAADLAMAESLADALCEGCPPVGYPTDRTRCLECPRNETLTKPLQECAGEGAGRVGDPSTINPHPPGSEQHVAWAKQHLEGLAERATAAKPAGQAC